MAFPRQKVPGSIPGWCGQAGCHQWCALFPPRYIPFAWFRKHVRASKVSILFQSILVACVSLQVYFSRLVGANHSILRHLHENVSSCIVARLPKVNTLSTSMATRNASFRPHKWSALTIRSTVDGCAVHLPIVSGANCFCSLHFTCFCNGQRRPLDIPSCPYVGTHVIHVHCEYCIHPPFYPYLLDTAYATVVSANAG